MEYTSYPRGAYVIQDGILRLTGSVSSRFLVSSHPVASILRFSFRAVVRAASRIMSRDSRLRSCSQLPSPSLSIRLNWSWSLLPSRRSSSVPPQQSRTMTSDSILGNVSRMSSNLLFCCGFPSQHFHPQASATPRTRTHMTYRVCST